MNIEVLQSILSIGETIGVEFKRCGNGIKSDVYETVCSFLNRFGGDIYIGILDDGTVVGVPKKAVPDMIKSFTKTISNPEILKPTVYLVPEKIEYEGYTIIHVHVPPSSEVHSYKKVIYDRVDDADVKVTATSAIAQMYIRKQNIYTERKIYPYAKMEDLRLDLLPKIRTMALNHAGGSHPWAEMKDQELLRSAGLYGKDMVTGEEGYNLAALLLLGKDEVILDVAPAYMTDALVRKVNIDRYDDREVIKTNLIESYDRLLEFGKKNLPDKFFLENTINKSLRNIIVREMVSNTLMHREFSNSYTAKFVIEKDRMYIENANRAVSEGVITINNLEPNPKNPIIASFFRNIGYADQLGSGVRNLFKYSRYYSGQTAEFIDGDIFRIIVPLDEAYSYDFEQTKSETNETKSETNETKSETKSETNETKSETNEVHDKDAFLKKARHLGLTKNEYVILCLIKEDSRITQKQLHEKSGISLGTIKRIIPDLQKKDIISRVGNNRSGQWVVHQSEEQ